jgi:autotransporter-associated beta strand protein
MKKSRLALNSAAIFGASLCWLPGVWGQGVPVNADGSPDGAYLYSGTTPTGNAANWGNLYDQISSVVITTGYENIQSQSTTVPANAVEAPAIFIQINVNPGTVASPTDITSGTEWWADYDVAMETVPGVGSTAVLNPGGNPMGISSGMNYYINGFNNKGTAPSTSGGNQVYNYNSGAWSQVAGVGQSNYFATTTSITATSITYGIPLSDLGLSVGNKFNFDVYSTYGTPGGQSAYDVLDNSAFSSGAPNYYPYLNNPSGSTATPYDSATASGSTYASTTFTVAAPTLTWNNSFAAAGFGDGMTWDNNTTNTPTNFNWNNGLFADYYVDGSNVIFNDVNNATSNGGTNSNAYNVTLNTIVAPASVLVNNSLGNYTISGAGAIGGTASLTKSGTGTLTISNANTYSGGTSINGGVLNVGNSGAIGATGTISFGGGTLQYSTSNTFDYSPRFNTAANQAYSVDTNGLNVTWATALSSSGGSLTKLGTGTLTLSSPNTYTAGTNINGGVLRMGSASALGTGPVAVASPGILDLNGKSPTIGNLSGSGTIDNITAGGAPILTINTTTSSNFSGVIHNDTGSVALTVGGTGTQILSGANTYSGGTTVTAGKLLIGQAGTNATIVSSTLTGANTLTALPTGTLSVGGNGIVQLADGVTNQTFVTPSAHSAVVTSNINLTSLSLTGDGTLDIGNNRIIVDYTSGHDPIASIGLWIANGFAESETAGSSPAIISSDIAADDAASGFSYGIGYADGADGVIAGLPSGEIEIMFTLLGDANLDGQVNSEDFTPFSTNLSKNGGWDQGDFNYDGSVNTEDFTSLSHDLNQPAALAASETGTLLSPFIGADGLSLTNVPEPASTGLLTTGLISVLARRRRKPKA